MSYQIHFEKHDNHIIADIAGKKALIDTGSPATIGTESFPFAGKMYPVHGEFGGASLSAISGELGTRIDWLVGADALSGYRITIDWNAQTLSVDDSSEETGGIPLTFKMGVPVVSAEINGAPVLMVFDTGAKISYAMSEVTDSVPATGTVSDFYPNFGTFETSTRNMRVSIASEAAELTVGQLPDDLGGLLLMMGVNGIIGNDLFKAYPRIAIDYPRKRLYLKR